MRIKADAEQTLPLSMTPYQYLKDILAGLES
jgi:hypothetical protein